MRTVIHVTVTSFLMVMFPLNVSIANTNSLFDAFGPYYCDEEVQKTFICKKNLFNSPEEFRMSYLNEIRINEREKKFAHKREEKLAKCKAGLIESTFIGTLKCSEYEPDFDEYQREQKLATCKAGLIESTSNCFEYLPYSEIKNVGYCINGKPLDEIPPWVFYSIEKTDDLEKTLVIDPKKPSASMVTRKRKFSTAKGYTWDEEKYYCKYE